MVSSKPGSSKKVKVSHSASKKVRGENFYHNAKTAGRLKMMKGGKPIYDRNGKMVQAAAFQKGEDETTPGRVQPDRRWFGNTRVISQTALDHFRTSLSTKQHDPYSVLLRRNKLPMALLDDASNSNLRKRTHIVETEPFKDTFGPKAQRKRPRLDAGDFEELSRVGAASQETEGTAEGETSTPAIPPAEEQTHADYIEPIYAKGTSRRIYGELYKVIDSSDVILHILDARDPIGTMCESVLEYVKKEKAHKQVVLVINKCDLVPNWVTARYVQHLTPRYPTIAFHASPNHSFGKGTLIQLLRQFSQLHSDKRQISIGFMGYPNVGKSSVINTLKSGKVCRVAPIPGETKVWQYITLTRKIYLIDCPGIVPASAQDTQTAKVLKGVVRVEALPTPSEHISTLISRVKPIYLARTYNLEASESGEPFDPDEVLDKLARMKGRLLKGGEPDLDGVAKILLSDWVRGKIPYFVPPPERPEELNKAEEAKRRKKEAKGKRKSQVADEQEERLHAIGVRQNLGSIVQKNTFIGEDIRPIEEEGGGGLEGEEGEEDVDGEEDESEGDELSWNDVFPEDAPPPRQSDDDASEDESGEEEDHVEGRTQLLPLEAYERPFPIDADDVLTDEEEDASVQKEARMTTNKRKATNFYTNTNVKNKNRKKAALMRALSSGARTDKSRKRK
ncbi:NGP1NT-domain-containing protein [Thelephora ganbajun]|uniref:NGP1NT-domain-containing protein n=1 Tax=Thelephora ganbajun TaxID=370292 RepID=A0ACB6YZK1_THEGA|nr:NGP1NT-domain-containing protein [Thelephora ganbajun]